MTDKPRLIERAFPLKQASLTSVHEKNVRHGHISTLHIWPARRPLAACRAALLATLLPDPGTPEERQKLCERIGGKVVQKTERKKMPNGSVVERVKEEVEGGVLGWIGTKPKSGGRKKLEDHQKLVAHREKELTWFREQIKKAYGGRVPRVLDPFAGGGAIPLEAMRLGCETTAADINPVAWFILKCTLEYPQKLAGKTHPLPDFILNDEEFMNEFYKAHPHLVGRTKRTKQQEKDAQNDLFESMKKDSGRIPKADLAWHVRAWGRWVHNEARKELAPYYPTYADFEPLDLKHPKPYERQPMQLVPVDDDGRANIDALNAEFSKEYLADKKNPRWVLKTTVAYLWARTVKCKNCRAVVPLLKTRWLCKKDGKRILLTVKPSPDKNGVEFGIQNDIPAQGGNAAQKREHDKRLGAGTMSQAGTKCVCCGAIMTLEDLRIEGQFDRIGEVLTAVSVEGQSGKTYRTPTDRDHGYVEKSSLGDLFSHLPKGQLTEPIPNNPRRFATPMYGMKTFGSLFRPRQALALGQLACAIRRLHSEMNNFEYSEDWTSAVSGYLSMALDRQADYCSTICTWHNSGEKLGHTFARFALPMVWDFCEVNPISNSSGNFEGAIEWIGLICENLSQITNPPTPEVKRQSVIDSTDSKYDVIVTDPPYYDAIPYSDISNFFYVWLARVVGDRFPNEFSDQIIPYAGELVMDRHHEALIEPRTREYYEAGMANAFSEMHRSLSAQGRLVVVFAHKEPDAWETLVAAMIRSGFVVDSSWPIQTEMGTRSNARNTAALASSVWLVCRKRDPNAGIGWDNKVLDEMRISITECLRAYWDAGIRGPDFVWAATGPALEAYSRYPAIKKANSPREVMSVGEFLSHVRRMVVDFVVGQVLTGEHGDSDLAAADRMDSPTAYYLLHRHDFGLDEAPAGACILYATACGLSDRDLESVWDLVSHTGSAPDEEEEPDPDEDAEPDDEGDSGSKIKLKTWAQRKRGSMGYEAPSGRPIPLIDRIHRLMHLWRAGDVHKVDEYLDDHGLRRQELFKRLVQSLIELSSAGSEERSLLESLSNHIQAKGAIRDDSQLSLKEEQ